MHCISHSIFPWEKLSYKPQILIMDLKAWYESAQVMLWWQ